MKKFFSFLALALVTLSNSAQTLKFAQAKPEKGGVITFTYNPKGGRLDRLAGISATAITMVDRDYYGRVPVKLSKNGEVYEGEFSVPDSINLAFLVFNAGQTIDENPDGYYTNFYKNGQVTGMSKFLEGYLFAGFGKSKAQMGVNYQKADELYQQAFKIDTLLRERFLTNSLMAKYQMNKAMGIKAINEATARYNALELNESNLTQVAQIHLIMNNKSAADSIYAMAKVKFPKGAYALADAVRGLSKFKNPLEKEEKFNQLLKEFNLSLERKEDLKRINWALPGLGGAFAAIQQNDKVEFYWDKFETKLTRSIMYYAEAKRNAAARINLEFSAKMAKKSVDLIEVIKQEERAKIGTSLDQSALDSYKLTHLVSYATILQLLNRNEEALDAVKEAVALNPTAAAANQLWISLLTKTGRLDEAMKLGEKFVLAGQETEEMKAQLKTAYKGSVPFESYYSALTVKAKATKTIEMAKEMIRLPAPQFTLMNLKGQKVSLANLKGKVVVVDYWATWCGPCLLSFPGMQAAINKYKDDPNVVFLFINTWEKGGDREKHVKEWVQANPNYTFNFLLDQLNDAGTDYEVVNKFNVTAIPSKFVIDANGDIRFKKVGSPETVGEIVKEMDTMIQLAKRSKK